MNNNIKRKDWVGGSAAVFKTLGASNHTDADRQREDYYATEPKATEWLCKLERFEGRILEPSCGEGHMSEVLKAAGYEVVSRDLVDRGYGEVADFLAIDNLAWDGNIVTNPPYKYAQQFVEKALSIIPEGKKVAMFLKLTFLEGKAHRALFRSTPHSCLGKLVTTEMRYEWRLRPVRRQRSGLRMVRVEERIQGRDNCKMV
ncbi:hypothetical protein [Prevotella sp.]|uniref:hypothetical protein n=1 Tax=Prevotella sp. TaxID=59823 RepID=UPI0027E31C7F|nr:hypothetical protein [Prevotella sp.]